MTYLPVISMSVRKRFKWCSLNRTGLWTDFQTTHTWSSCWLRFKAYKWKWNRSLTNRCKWGSTRALLVWWRDLKFWIKVSIRTMSSVLIIRDLSGAYRGPKTDTRISQRKLTPNYTDPNLTISPIPRSSSGKKLSPTKPRRWVLTINNWWASAQGRESLHHRQISNLLVSL